MFEAIRRPLYILIGLSLTAAIGSAQEAAQFFRENCVSCHTVGGGRLTGPDLKNVTQRKERDWLVEFLTNPQAMMDKGDPYALKLQQEARGFGVRDGDGRGNDWRRVLRGRRRRTATSSTAAGGERQCREG